MTEAMFQHVRVVGGKSERSSFDLDNVRSRTVRSRLATGSRAAVRQKRVPAVRKRALMLSGPGGVDGGNDAEVRLQGNAPETRACFQGYY